MNVIITGASGGIGAEVAFQLASRTDVANVGLIARRADALSAVAHRCSQRSNDTACDLAEEKVVTYVGDVSDEKVVEAAVSFFCTKFKDRIDVLINNVGRGDNKKPSELTDDDIRSMMEVNVMTAVRCIRRVLPLMRAAAPGGRGHIINVSSLLGRISSGPSCPGYSASKHFLNAYTSSLRAELKGTHPNIVVSTVSPGPVLTDFGINAGFVPAPSIATAPVQSPSSGSAASTLPSSQPSLSPTTSVSAVAAVDATPPTTSAAAPTPAGDAEAGDARRDAESPATTAATVSDGTASPAIPASSSADISPTASEANHYPRKGKCPGEVWPPTQYPPKQPVHEAAAAIVFCVVNRVEEMYTAPGLRSRVLRYMEDLAKDYCPTMNRLVG
jgi:short-subunit dehydrogenase